jgi:hypothetical protein
LFVNGSTLVGEEKTLPYIENPNWRPAASKLLEVVTGDRYETEHILDLRPENFDELQIERYRALARTNRFRDVNREFECKYMLFRYALSRWIFTTDDPYTEKQFKERYLSFQDLCRRLDRQHAFSDCQQVEQADWVKDPFEVYRYFLFVYLDELALQLDTRENPKRPYTLAEDYIDYPCATNTRQLKDAFFLINRYFESANYTWNRYISQPKFELARQKLYVGEWEQEKKRYWALLQQKRDSIGYREALEEARQSANYTYTRLRKEGETNCLSYFSKVDALYLSHSLDDYFKKVDEEKQIAERREAAAKQKEVVIFVHGLGQDRTCWGLFPELLAREDLADAGLKKYYSVYVFQYTTQEKSEGVEDFKVGLAHFIDHVRETEKAQKVTLIGHSFGGVLALRYLTDNDPKTGRPYRENVDRFIAFAPSLHGSHVANMMVEMFGKKEEQFRRDLPPFSHGMPFVGKMGDLQIVQNQIGSEVNLSSFETLDRRKCLDGIKALTIIGDPFTLAGIFSPGGRSENDGLVKTFSANLNHFFMDGGSGEKDIGYAGAEVRYADYRHFPMIKAMDRKHIGYRYATSFLRGELLPQVSPRDFQVKYFLAAIRVFPAGRASFGRFFLPRPQKSPQGGLILPALAIKASPARGATTPTVELHQDQWNLGTGVYFVEGHVSGGQSKANLKLRLSAEGYEPKELDLPVMGGRVTYATGITLNLSTSSRRTSASSVEP